MAVGLTIESTGESCPSFSGESIIVIRAVKIEGSENKLTLTLPKSLEVTCKLPSTYGTTEVEDGVFTAPSGTKAGDKFFLLGHYAKTGAPVLSMASVPPEDDDS